jgi:hypothetical protein
LFPLDLFLGMDGLFFQAFRAAGALFFPVFEPVEVVFCFFGFLMLFLCTSRDFQVLGLTGELSGEDKAPCFVCFLEELFASKFWNFDLRFSLHYCTTPASPLGLSASSESPDVRRVPHRPLHIGAWHLRTRVLPGACWPHTTLPPSTFMTDGDFRTLWCFPAGAPPPLTRLRWWFFLLSCFFFLDAIFPTIFVGGVFFWLCVSLHMFC